MPARLTSELLLALRVPAPGQPDRPLLECLEPRRKARPNGKARTLILRGELCVFSTPFLRDHLDRSAASESLVLDVADVTLIDSSALTILDDANDRWQERGLSIRLAHGRDHVARVVDLLGLGHLLAVPSLGDGTVGSSAVRPRNPTGCAPPVERTCTKAPGADAGPPSVELTVRNREGGQVVEVTPHGCVRADDVASVKARLDRLIEVREPRELWIDLRDTTGDLLLVGLLVDASDALWSIGAKLVVRHPSSDLRQEILPRAADRMVIDGRG